MTIKEAYEMYTMQMEKINKTKKNIKLMLGMLNEKTLTSDPFKSVALDKYEATEVIEELMDYVKYLEATLEDLV